ncbi:hypothetical protein D3C75_741050 [compost metagenome]
MSTVRRCCGKINSYRAGIHQQRGVLRQVDSESPRQRAVQRCALQWHLRKLFAIHPQLHALNAFLAGQRPGDRFKYFTLICRFIIVKLGVELNHSQLGLVYGDILYLCSGRKHTLEALRQCRGILPLADQRSKRILQHGAIIAFWQAYGHRCEQSIVIFQEDGCPVPGFSSRRSIRAYSCRKTGFIQRRRPEYSCIQRPFTADLQHLRFYFTGRRIYRCRFRTEQAAAGQS